MSVAELKYALFKDIDQIEDESLLRKLSAYIRRKTQTMPRLDEIPEEYRQDPYRYSPSGDTFYADRRNTDELDRRLREAGKDKIVATVHTAEELKQFLKGTTKS